MSFAEKAQNIQLLLLDVDGVLTDGGLVLGTGEGEFKRFNVQDGMGLSLAREAGLKVGIITGRESEAVTRRAQELKMDELIQGSKEKVAALDLACEHHGLTRDQVAYMGDDIQDLGILLACGLSMTPRNGRPEVQVRVDLVTEARGGHGAVREAIEAILKATHRWDDLLRKYGAGS
jgi:3-deoxy-D-manno-octulosonate 8-phosphate phosphatase (KDO 8-P phosphatase)